MSDQNNEHIDPSAPAAEEIVEEIVTARTPEGEELSPERLGDLAIKFATETAYAAAGVADFVARSTKGFIDAQRKQLAERTPEGVDPNFKRFVDQMPDQFKAFMDDVTRTYHDMAERGRGAVSDFQAQMQPPKTPRPPATGAYDLNDDVEADDAESVVADDEPAVVEEVVEESAMDAPVVSESWPGEGDEERR